MLPFHHSRDATSIVPSGLLLSKPEPGLLQGVSRSCLLPYGESV